MDAQVRISKPGSCGVSLMLVFEDTFNNEDLLASEMPMSIEMRARRPANKRRAAVPETVERTDEKPRYQAVAPDPVLREVHHSSRIARGKVTQLDEQLASADGFGRMMRAGWVLHV